MPAAIVGRDGTVWGAVGGAENIKQAEMMRLARGMEVGERSLEKRVFITFAGQELTDGNAQLSDLGVCSETTVLLGPDAGKAKGVIPEDSVGMTVYVQNPQGGETVSVDVGVETTVSELAAVAFQRFTTMGTDIPTGRLRATDADDFRSSGPSLLGGRYVCQKYEHDSAGLAEAHFRRIRRGGGGDGMDGLMILQTQRSNIVFFYGDSDGGPGTASMRATSLQNKMYAQGL